jgi:hypothetical protein
MVVVFIRQNCLQMFFVYFGFWGLQEELSTNQNYEVKQGKQGRVDNSSCKPQKPK